MDYNFHELPQDAISTNLLLPDTVQYQIRSTLSTFQQKIESVDHRIAEIESMLGQLVAQRTNIVSRMLPYQCAIAPHRKLPNEILGEIFKQCVPSKHIAVPWLGVEAPHNLLGVCSNWRRVAIGISALWCDLKVDYGDWSSYTRITEASLAVLERTSQSPVILEITGRDWYKCSHSSATRAMASSPISELVVPHASRFKNVSLDINFDWAAEFFRLSSGMIDSLEIIKLNFYEHPNPLYNWDNLDTFHDSHVTVFNSAKSLRCINLSSRRKIIKISPLALRLPWGQLTSLRCRKIVFPVQEALLVLQECKRLVDCSLGLSSMDRRAASGSISPTMVPTVKSFELEVFGEFQSLLQLLRLPHVEHVGLSSDDLTAMGNVLWEAAFVQFLTRSTSLTSLFLGVGIPESAMLLLLQSLPSIVRLSLGRWAFFTNRILRCFSREDLLPNLEALSCCTSSYNFDTLVHMLECRWMNTGTTDPSPGNRIRDVTLYAGAREIADMYSQDERLERLRSIGGRIVVSSQMCYSNW